MKQEKNILDHNLIKPCPFCGWKVSRDKDDFIYPTGVSFIVWQAVCANPKCGCIILGYSVKNVMEKWNDRKN